MSSVIGTKVTVENGLVNKVTPLTLNWDTALLRELIVDYHKKLINANLPVPNILSLDVNKERIEMMMEYKGEPIAWGEYIPEMLEIVNLAKDNNVCIDPHWKNFVKDDKGKIWYVDVTPPRSEEYYTAALNLVPNKTLFKHLYDTFRPDSLVSHFIADISKTNPRINEIVMIEEKAKSLDWRVI